MELSDNRDFPVFSDFQTHKFTINDVREIRDQFLVGYMNHSCRSNLTLEKIASVGARGPNLGTAVLQSKSKIPNLEYFLASYEYHL